MENGVEYWKAVELDADDPEGTNRFILQNPGNNNDPMTGERLLRIQHIPTKTRSLRKMRSLNTDCTLNYYATVE